MVKPNLQIDNLSKINWSKRSEWLIVGAVCIGSLALRLYVLRFHTLVTFDGTFYINYFRDESWQSVFHPGYSLFIELFRFFIPDGVKAAQMVSIVSGAILPIPLFFLARNFINSLLSILATLVVVLDPLLIRFSATTLSESLFILLEVTAFLFYFRRQPILFGISSGLAYLTRPEALLFFILLLVYEIIGYRQRQFIGFVLGGFLVCALPYIIYLRIHSGEWTLTAKTMNLRVWEKDWHINVASEASDAPTFSLSKQICSGLKHYPARLKEYTSHFLRFAGIPLVLIGCIGMIKCRNVLLAGIAMFFILPLFGLETSERFIIPYIPFLILFAFIFLSEWEKIWVAFLGAFIIILGYSPTATYAAIPEQGITEFCTAGLAVKPITKEGDIFVDRKPFTAFYAGGKYITMPNDPVDSILAFCRRVQARYLVVSARVVRVFRPQLNFLLYSDTVLNRLNLKTAYIAGLDSGYGVRIIKLKQ